MKYPELERYLADLEKALGSISVSERSEIILEIKSHVLDAIERDPSLEVRKILGSLGEPSQVANRYLLERGLQPQKLPRANVVVSSVKWLSVGLIGSVAIIMLGSIVLFSFFSPIFEVNEDTGRVRILGGMIDIQSSEGGTHEFNLKVGDIKSDLSDIFGKGGSKDFNGSQVLPPASPNQKTEVNIDFGNGKFEIQNADAREVRWECKVSEKADTSKMASVKGNRFNFDIKSTGANCDIWIPKGAEFAMNGKNGNISLDNLMNPIQFEMHNGQVEVGLNPTAKYNVQAKLNNGHIDEFPTHPDGTKDLIPVNIKINNGQIVKK